MVSDILRFKFLCSLQSFRDRVKSTLKTKKVVGRPETYSATSGSVQRVGLARSKSWGKPEGCVLCGPIIISFNFLFTHPVSLSRDLILPRMRGGRSLENLHRVSSGEPEGQISLGEPGTFVRVLNTIIFTEKSLN